MQDRLVAILGQPPRLGSAYIVEGVAPLGDNVKSAEEIQRAGAAFAEGLDLRGSDDSMQRQTFRVDKSVPLIAFDRLTRVMSILINISTAFLVTGAGAPPCSARAV